MIEQINRDSAEFPALFHWRGPLSMQQVERWEREWSVSIPSDLKLLWTLRGGCDLFESETILQPFGSSEDNLVIPVSRLFHDQGLDQDSLVFHKGFCISLFCGLDSLFRTRGLTGLEHIAVFEDLDSWYKATLRVEYGQRYRLER